MFSKIDKKVLGILVIALLIILVIGLFAYKYISNNSSPEIQNTAGGVQTNDQESPQVQIGPDDIQVQTGSSGGSLSVCLDECGNGICQQADNDCSMNDSMNCVCPESAQDCPNDCQ